MRIVLLQHMTTFCYHTLQTQGNLSNCWWNVSWPRRHCFRISKGFGIDQSPRNFNEVNKEQEIQRGPPWVSFIWDVILPLIFWNNKGKNKIRSSVDSTSIITFTICRYIVPGRGAWIKGKMVVPSILFSRAPLAGWTAHHFPYEYTRPS